MDIQDSKQSPSPYIVGIQCALVVIGFACVVLAIHYFPEAWIDAFKAHKAESDEALVNTINSLVVPWWYVLISVCVHLWTTGVAWRLRGHPSASSKGLTFFRGVFKDATECAALVLIGLYEYLDGMTVADVFFLLSMLFMIPRLARFFFSSASPKQ